MFLPAVYHLASLSGATPMAYPNTMSWFSAVTLATPMASHRRELVVTAASTTHGIPWRLRSRFTSS